ncbi:hypothetical protein C8R43DRAFT_881836 [Mycena crocata]|nr:hypothetical protein C8R43DRAFT_881836 [Mycena crocata]
MQILDKEQVQRHGSIGYESKRLCALKSGRPLVSRDTIVIRAETKIFQVSRAILAARSTVFRDMIAFPQPTSGDVEISELHDSAADVEVFLRAIFDSSFFMPAPEPIELSVVLGILRLSHKYDVQYLFRRALQHLAEGEW